MASIKLKVKSKTDPTRTYTVYVDESGPTFCECPSFKFQKRRVEDRAPCKHMRGLADVTQPATA